MLQKFEILLTWINDRLSFCYKVIRSSTKLEKIIKNTCAVFYIQNLKVQERKNAKSNAVP